MRILIHSPEITMRLKKSKKYVHKKQCCGSGSAWIWNFCLNPDPELLFQIQQNVKEQISWFVYNFQIWIQIRMDPELGKLRAGFGSGINHYGIHNTAKKYLHLIDGKGPIHETNLQCALKVDPFFLIIENV